MNIFYSKKTLNSNLILITNSDGVHHEKYLNNNVYYFNQNNELIGFNMKLESHQLSLSDGRQYLSTDLKKFIETTSGFNLCNMNSGFVVGKVISCEPIEGTHLHNCVVDIKIEKLKIVCGAKNVTEGLLTVVATINTMMDSGLFIKASKLKGYDSFGMLCSQKELNLSNYNPEGIIELNSSDYHIGDIFKPMYKNLV